MHLKKMFLALCACLVVSGAVASAAQAVTWKVGENKETLTEETVSVSGGPWTLSSAPLGIEVQLSADGVECTPGVTCRIFGEGESAGALTFTNVTVDNPTGCTVHSPGAPAGRVDTEPLKDQLVHPDPENPTATYDEFFPATGSVFVVLVFGGEECVLNELEVPVEGVTYGRANNTGVMASPQPLVFNQAEEEAAGSTLAVGGSPAILTGTASNVLSGPNAGKVFGAE